MSRNSSVATTGETELILTELLPPIRQLNNIRSFTSSRSNDFLQFDYHPLLSTETLDPRSDDDMDVEQDSELNNSPFSLQEDCSSVIYPSSTSPTPPPTPANLPPKNIDEDLDDFAESQMPPVDDTQPHCNLALWEKYLRDQFENYTGSSLLAHELRTLNIGWKGHQSYLGWIEIEFDVAYRALHLLGNGKKMRKNIQDWESEEMYAIYEELQYIKNHPVLIDLTSD